MKVLKSAKQKNVVLASEFYTEYDICKMLDENKVFYISNDGQIKHDSVEYIVTDTEVRIFTDLIERLEVEYSKECESYVTVAKMKDGTSLIINL